MGIILDEISFIKAIEDRNQALELALERGKDTFLQLTECRKGMGRNKNGLWDVAIPFNKRNLVNFIAYEQSNGRGVAIWAHSEEYIRDAQHILRTYKEESDKLNHNSEEILCHSTSKENIYSILESGFLKSYGMLVSEGVEVNTIRGILKEPSEYLNLIDFGSINSAAPEIVVASREFGRINENIDFIYVPGVRMYFKKKDLIDSGRFVEDGLHLARIKDQIAIDRAWKIVIPFEEEFQREIRNRKIIVSQEIKEKIVFIEEKEVWNPWDFIHCTNSVLEEEE